MGDARRSGECVNLHRLAQEKNLSFFFLGGDRWLKMHALFLFNLRSRSNKGGGGSAVKPTAVAFAGFLYEASVQAAAALDSVEVDATACLGLPLGALAAAASGAAAATDLQDATLLSGRGRSLLVLRLIRRMRRFFRARGSLLLRLICWTGAGVYRHFPGRQWWSVEFYLHGDAFCSWYGEFV